MTCFLSTSCYNNVIFLDKISGSGVLTKYKSLSQKVISLTVAYTSKNYRCKRGFMRFYSQNPASIFGIIVVNYLHIQYLKTL